jgi:hypothetical protein
MTPTTVVMLPVILVAALGPPGILLACLLAAAAFDDAALFFVGGSAIYLAWFVMILTAARCLIAAYPLYKDELREAVVAFSPLIVLFFYGLVAYFLALATLYEKVRVMPGSAMYLYSNARQFRFAPEQINQNIYMAATLTCLLIVTVYLSRYPLTRLSVLCARLYFVGAGVGFVTMIWHYLALRYGIWFPSAVLHSARSIAAWNQSVAGVYRISGSFAEPSAVAGFFTPVLFFCGTLAVLGPSLRAALMTLVSIFCLVISTSTTAYAVTAGFIAYFLVLLLTALLTGGPRLRANAAALGFLSLLALAGGMIYLLDNYAYFRELIYFTLNKDNSGSFAMRGTANKLAVDIFFESYGLGLGLGSHRASGLIFGLLAAFGLAGIVGFAVFVALHLRRSLVLARMLPEQRGVVLALAAAGLTGLGAAAISAGEMTSYVFYLPFAVLTAFWIGMRREEAGGVAPVEQIDLLHPALELTPRTQYRAR